MITSPGPSGTATLIIAMIMIIAAGVLVGVGGRVLLRGLPEPVPPADADEATLTDYRTKISYRALATSRFAVITGLLAAAGAAIAVLTQPVAYWPVWLAFGTVGVLLAAVDARTTWLPAPLMVLGWIVTAAAVLAGLAVDHRVHPAVTIGSGVLIAGGGYLLLWWITGGRAIAFGDVRLMLLVGAAAGSLGWAGIYWSLLLGSVIGAVIGVVRLLGGRRGPFPYGPALVSGPYAAALLLSVLP